MMLWLLDGMMSGSDNGRDCGDHYQYLLAMPKGQWSHCFSEGFFCWCWITRFSSATAIPLRGGSLWDTFISREIIAEQVQTCQAIQEIFLYVCVRVQVQVTHCKTQQSLFRPMSYQRRLPTLSLIARFDKWLHQPVQYGVLICLRSEITWTILSFLSVLMCRPWTTQHTCLPFLARRAAWLFIVSKTRFRFILLVCASVILKWRCLLMIKE